MREGGERVIIVPPALGYGNKKSGSIPPNSTLKFGTYQLDSGLPNECRYAQGWYFTEVKLLSIK